MEKTEIIHSIQQGNYKKYLKLYEYYFPKIYQFLFYLNLGDAQKAQQQSNQTFLLGFKQIESLELKNLAAEDLLLRFYALAYQQLDWDSSAQTITSSLSEKEQGSPFWQNMLALELKERAIFLLKLWLELSYAQIAKVLGNAEQTIKSDFFDSLSKLLA